MVLYLKAFHIISMVAWFAGMFYIFRLYVYHVGHREMASVYGLMEHKLLRFIMLPAFVLTASSGLGMLAMNPALIGRPWMQGKLIGVFGLIVYHAFAEYTYHRFSRGDFFLSERDCRIVNEMPTVFLILIVTLAVVKP